MFIPRHPVVENQFCFYTSQTTDATGVGGVLCYAGAVLYLDKSAANEESIVKRYDTHTNEPTDDDERVPFGFSMQKVKTGYHQVHPTGFYMPGDLGSSDVIAQPSYDAATHAINGTKPAPLSVAHNGIWDTVHYRCKHATGTVTDGDHMKPGQMLYVAANSGGAVTNYNAGAADDVDDGERLPNVTTIVGRVVKGASAAKCTANIGNTTLYAIRIKLLV